MRGDQAFFMGCADARLPALRACPFQLGSVQGRSWMRGWRYVRGAEYVPPQPPTEEQVRAALIVRLERLQRRDGNLAVGTYWTLAEDLMLIDLSRAGLSLEPCVEKMGRTAWSITARRKVLERAGFADEMKPPRPAKGATERADAARAGAA